MTPEFSISKPAPGVLVARLAGSGILALGGAPLRELTRHVERMEKVEIYLDASALEGTSVEQSDAWALWFARHRARLKQVHLLPAAKFIHVSPEFLRRFADTKGMLRIYTSRAAYESELAASVLTSRRRVIAILDWMGRERRQPGGAARISS
jgi:hypothetical protein